MITNYNSNRTNNKSSLTKLFVTTVVVAFLMSLASCEIETSDNGELDGFWHLERIDSLENGKTEQTSDSLYINKVYENHWHEDNPNDEVGGDVPVEVANDETRHYGINNIPEGFLKERLDGSKMILRSKMLRLTFRRF